MLEDDNYNSNNNSSYLIERLCARAHPKHFTWVHSLNPHKNPSRHYYSPHFPDEKTGAHRS